MKVFLTSAYKSFKHKTSAEWLRSGSPLAESICTNDPNEADVILFVERNKIGDPYFRTVLHDDLLKKYKSKCVLYHDADSSITPLPTLSPSIELWQYKREHKRSIHYIKIWENDTINNTIINYDINRDFLYSFMGSRSHSIRDRLFAMKHGSGAFLKDTTGLKTWEMDSDEKMNFQQEYIDVINKSFFVLAPRGFGPCSYRLFEVMRLGRVPVIISDAWVSIPNLNWNEFSIIIPESKISQLSAILNERKNEAIEMGKKARKYWEDFFSPETSLEQISKAAMELLQHKYSFIDAIHDYSQFLRRPSHLKNYIKWKVKSFKRWF